MNPLIAVAWILIFHFKDINPSMKVTSEVVSRAIALIIYLKIIRDTIKYNIDDIKSTLGLTSLRSEFLPLYRKYGNTDPLMTTNGKSKNAVKTP